MKTIMLFLFSAFASVAIAQEKKPELFVGPKQEKKLVLAAETALEIRTLEMQGFKMVAQANSVQLQIQPLQIKLQELRSQINAKDAEVAKEIDAVLDQMGIDKTKFTIDADSLVIVEKPKQYEPLKYQGKLTVPQSGSVEFAFPKDDRVDLPNCNATYESGGPPPPGPAVTNEKFAVSGAKPGNVVVYECTSRKLKQ